MSLTRFLDEDVSGNALVSLLQQAYQRLYIRVAAAQEQKRFQTLR